MLTTRKLLAAGLAFLFGVSLLLGQISRSHVWSNPGLPSEENLARLGLRQAWRGFIPMDGKKDGILRVDIIDRDLFVVTRSGLVMRLDAETGIPHWRARVGKPYTITPFLAANTRAVYVGANARMVALDRESGNQSWEYDLPAGVSAAPVVDEERLFIPTSTTRMYAFRLPDVIGTDANPQLEGVGLSTLFNLDREGDRDNRPHLEWASLTNIYLLIAPVQSSDVLFAMSPEGEGIGFSKVRREGLSTPILYRISTDGKLVAPLGSYGDTVYIGSDDAALYAINMNTGKLRWRHSAGTGISRRPIALDRDLFVTSQREGLARLDRESGDTLWKIPVAGVLQPANPRADRFLAASENFVYASDNSGRLLILDRRRGSVLSMLDTSAYHVPVVNQVTDRLYLAANDGLIVCLHDRTQRTPLRHRRALEETTSPVEKRLLQPVTDTGGRKAPLREVLSEMSQRYGVAFAYADAAFKAAGLPDPRNRPIEIKRVDKKPLKEFLQTILDQVGATYDVVGRVVQIVPGKAKDG